MYAVHVRQLAGASPVPTWWRWRVAKRKGVTARWGLKEAWSKDTGRCTRTGLEAYGVGRVGIWQRSPYPSRMLVVNPAVAYRKQSSLSRESCCIVSNSWLRVE